MCQFNVFQDRLGGWGNSTHNIRLHFKETNANICYESLRKVLFLVCLAIFNLLIGVVNMVKNNLVDCLASVLLRSPSIQGELYCVVVNFKVIQILQWSKVPWII